MFRKPSKLRIGIFMALFGILSVCFVGVLFFTQDDEDISQYATILDDTNPYVSTYIVQTSTALALIDRILTLVAKTPTMEDATAQIDHIRAVIAGTQTAEATPDKN
ncbi:MAG: hypothetical protein HY862_01075 [Chloroflexi bacterium]|nr:hypothetical protein [Chloroflexota bacterium]